MAIGVPGTAAAPADSDASAAGGEGTAAAASPPTDPCAALAASVDQLRAAFAKHTEWLELECHAIRRTDQRQAAGASFTAKDLKSVGALETLLWRSLNEVESALAASTNEAREQLRELREMLGGSSVPMAE